ncbi:MAG: nitric-oxide reductase large subunit, partial [Acidobacteriota bacterium]
MATEDSVEAERLSPWWRWGVLIIMAVEFAVLIGIATNTYVNQVGPPIPDKVVDDSGNLLYTGQEILSGQQVFLRYALMDNGTVWGHGAYLGPDFSAEYLHGVALEVSDYLAQQTYHLPAKELTPDQGASLRARVARFMAENRYDPGTRTLVLTPPEVTSWNNQVARWERYFSGSEASRGLPVKTIQSKAELNQLNTFFAWTAWGAVARQPGTDYSYTNNFPYDPLVGNGPSSAAILWSALSLVSLLAGTAFILLAFGRFHYLGWHSRALSAPPQLIQGKPTPGERATIKFFLVVVLLLLLQTLAGGALAHYLAEPGGFFGLDLKSVFPSNVLRSWHLQSAIFWIAIAYVGGGIFLASALGGRDRKHQSAFIHLLFAAVGIVLIGSLAGEYFGFRQD